MSTIQQKNHKMIPKQEETINTLLGYDLKIIQRPDMFNYSLDSTLLADFSTIPKRAKNILDLGTGFAPIPLLLSQKTQVPIIGIELQEAVYKIAKRNIQLNNLDNQVTIIQADINQLKTLYNHQSFDVITSNPPFFKVTKDANLNDNMYKTIARHEVAVTLEVLIKTVSYLLKDKGYFTLVHRPNRLDEIITLCKAYNLSIKRLRFVYPKIDKEASMVLIEMMKNGLQSIRILPPLIVHNDDGYTKEMKKIFNDERM